MTQNKTKQNADVIEEIKVLKLKEVGIKEICYQKERNMLQY